MPSSARVSLATLLAYVVVAVHSASLSTMANPVLSDDLLMRARKSQVKATILNQLGLSHNESRRLNEQARTGAGARSDLRIPKRLRDELLEANSWMYEKKDEEPTEEEVLGDVTQLLMFAQKYPKVGYQCSGAAAKSPSVCLSFDVTDVSANTRVESATLWMYKRRDRRDGPHQVFVIDEVLPPEYEQRLRPSDSDLATTDIKTGWVVADVTRVVSRWLSKSYQHRELKVVCKTCAMYAKYSPVDYRGDHRPLIVVNTRKVISPARRRFARTTNTLECDGDRNRDGHCCLHRFNITFAEIDMDFIIQPRKFPANYCSGSCSTPGVVSSKYMVSSVLQSAAQTEDDPLVRAAMTPCCAPLLVRNMSVLYQGDANTDKVISSTLHNIGIEKCGCA